MVHPDRIHGVVVGLPPRHQPVRDGCAGLGVERVVELQAGEGRQQADYQPHQFGFHNVNFPAPASSQKSAEPSANIPGGTPGASPTKAPAGTSTAGTTADTMTAPESGSPAVPPELLSQARDAKEHFDKGNYYWLLIYLFYFL